MCLCSVRDTRTFEKRLASEREKAFWIFLFCSILMPVLLISCFITEDLSSHLCAVLLNCCMPLDKSTKTFLMGLVFILILGL